jgi:D-alanyl-D-alanine carboxypeptidase
MNRRAVPTAPSWPSRILCLTLLTVLAACSSHPVRQSARHHQYAPTRYYPPPGPPSDPWGPYIHEASGRFGIPEPWIRSVMRQESGGQQDVISWAGAMGLMQVMPDTYDELRYRYSLGDDPFDPHNNILAGTAYLREMYDRYGAPGFLAAYNAGPKRLDRYLAYGKPLPAETVNYVAAIAPRLGPGTPMSGPLAVYGGSRTRYASARRTPSGCDPDAAYNPDGACTPLRRTEVQPVVMASAAPSYQGSSGCDPDAAYNPDGPCTPLRPAAIQPAVLASGAPSYSGSFGCDPDSAYNPDGPCTPLRPAEVSPVVAMAASPAGGAECDPDAAYDPGRPCRPLPQPAAPVVAQPLPAPPPVIAQTLPPPPARYGGGARPMQEMTAQRAAYTPTPPGYWGIQVGAFASLSTAQNAAENARMAAPDLLRTTKIVLPATTPFGSQVAFRARLLGLSQSAAVDACGRLSRQGIACITVPPDRGSS